MYQKNRSGERSERLLLKVSLPLSLSVVFFPSADLLLFPLFLSSLCSASSFLQFHSSSFRIKAKKRHEQIRAFGHLSSSPKIIEQVNTPISSSFFSSSFSRSLIIMTSQDRSPTTSTLSEFEINNPKLS